MTDARFALEILTQHWIDWTEPETDLCSHGSLRLTIGGRPITVEGNDYGVSESALAMLRSVYADHTPQKPVAEKMILHGCGTILMMGCPIGIDWSVRHHGGTVVIDDVVRYDTTNESEAARFPNLAVALGEAEYKDHIMRFARQVKNFFAGTNKDFADNWEKQQYDVLWKEFDELLDR